MKQKTTKKGRKPKKFFKYCDRCGEKFHPTGKWGRLCPYCRKIINYKPKQNVNP